MLNTKLLIVNNTRYKLSKEKENFINYFSKNGIGFTIEEKSTNIKTSSFVYKSVDGFNADTGKAQKVKYLKLEDSIRNDIQPLIVDQEIVMFVNKVGDKKADEVFTNWTDRLPIKNTIFIQIIINDYLKRNGGVAHAMLHEAMHALCYDLNAKGYQVVDEMDIDHLGRKFYNDKEPNNPDSNFGFTLKNIKRFMGKKSLKQTLLERLQELYALLAVKKQNTYKYFTESEVEGLDHEFVLLLDKSRGIAGIPFSINSGFRTVAHNKAVGGVKGSSHTKGLAVDLRARNGKEIYTIVNALMQVGIKRIGINWDKQFIHCDVDYTKPTPTIYKY